MNGRIVGQSLDGYPAVKGGFDRVGVDTEAIDFLDKIACVASPPHQSALRANEDFTIAVIQGDVRDLVAE